MEIEGKDTISIANNINAYQQANAPVLLAWYPNSNSARSYHAHTYCTVIHTTWFGYLHVHVVFIPSTFLFPTLWDSVTFIHTCNFPPLFGKIFSLPLYVAFSPPTTTSQRRYSVAQEREREATSPLQPYTCWGEKISPHHHYHHYHPTHTPFSTS